MVIIVCVYVGNTAASQPCVLRGQSAAPPTHTHPNPCPTGRLTSLTASVCPLRTHTHTYTHTHPFSGHGNGNPIWNRPPFWSRGTPSMCSPPSPLCLLPLPQSSYITGPGTELSGAIGQLTERREGGRHHPTLEGWRCVCVGVLMCVCAHACLCLSQHSS